VPDPPQLRNRRVDERDLAARSHGPVERRR
jgi:hypothetical protein